MEGKTLQEIEEAPTEQALLDKLQGQGYFVISLQPMRTEAPKPETKKTRKVKKDSFTHTGITMDDILVFSRQLATMLEAGITLLRSLDVILSQIESRTLHKVLTQVRNDVEQGRSLSSSLEKHPKHFSQFWVSLVEVGEASGTMPQVLEKLAIFMEQQAAFRSIIISAIIYPCILLMVCLGAIGFFAFFVGPKFEAIYTSMGKQLPAFTKLLLAVFKFIKQNILFLIAGCVAASFMFGQYIKTAVGQMQFEKFIFALPTFGMITKKIVVERFASQMSILIDSGVPILYALEISEKLVENRTCGLIISDIRDSVREGKMLAEPMELSGFFPPMAVQMIKVGEETGELSKMLKHVSAFFQREVEAFMKRFGTLIEPLMLVVMGGVIGTIVLAMFLPMFSIGG
ncbi:MAG: type II secretion system F family protein [Candidatus Omnitrophica bacterium]|nr:type II secretion system F family protein [Candidatus Omnitrophota bacterium]